MGIVVKTGPGAIVGHGMITAWGPTLDLTVNQPEGPFSFRLAFVSDADSEDPRVDTIWEGDLMVLECHNFDDAEGRGSARPVLLCELGEDLLFMHFRVFRFGATWDRTVHYTFYRVPKEAVGWTPSDG